MSINYTLHNILLIQLGDIGDVVLTTPTIRAVKETHPEASISIIVRKPFGSLLLADQNLHEVVEVAKIRGSAFRNMQKYGKLICHLRHAHYDLVIDLRTGDHGAILSFLTGAPMRVGSPGSKKQFWRKFVFTNILENIKAASPPVHPGADQSLRIVRGIGIDTADTLPRLFISARDQARAKELLDECKLASGMRWITINPYSRWKYKEWSNAKWGEVIDLLWKTYRIPAVLIGSPNEAAGCQEIAAGREGRAFSLAGKTTLGELAAVISMSSLHLGVDSAASHIAAALGTPTVTIHGPTDWRAWRIVNDRHRVVSSEMDCIPCSMMGCNGSGKSQCLDELGVETVAGAALDILNTIAFSEQSQNSSADH